MRMIHASWRESILLEGQICLCFSCHTQFPSLFPSSHTLTLGLHALSLLDLCATPLSSLLHFFNPRMHGCSRCEKKLVFSMFFFFFCLDFHKPLNYALIRGHYQGGLWLKHPIYESSKFEVQGILALRTHHPSYIYTPKGPIIGRRGASVSCVR